MRVTTIINGKGGVGKTTTTHALASALTRKGYKTIAIDNDPQGNLSYGFGAKTDDVATLFHVMNQEATVSEAVQQTPQGYIIAGNSFLTKVDVLYSGADVFDGIMKLQEIIHELQRMGFSHVLIDNQPLIGGMLTRQALAAADDLIVPMNADVYSIKGLVDLQKAVTSMKRFNPQLSIDGVLMTKHHPRTVISADLGGQIEQWAASHQTRMYKTFIRESVAIKEAQAQKQSIFDYAPQSNPAVDYAAFTEEYLGGKANG